MVHKMTVNSEEVLVVPAACLWARVKYADRELITEGIEQLATVVANCGSFLDRPAVETDPTYKQIIPYAIVRCKDSYFLLQRTPAQSEKRLHYKLSIGVGGHINPSEGALGPDAIQQGLRREIDEELQIASGYTARLIGLINDDTTDVGRVHLGVLYEIDSTSPEVQVRETHKMHGSWAPMDTLQESYDRLETWSQIVYDSFLCPRVCSGPLRS